MSRYHSLTFDAKTRQLKNEPDEEAEVAASLDGSYLLRLTVRIFRPRRVADLHLSHTPTETLSVA